jgi:hypothetical protein
MIREPLTGGSTGAPPVVEGPIEWGWIEVERAIRLAAASPLDPEQFRAVARALLTRAAVTPLVDPQPAV